MIGAAVATWRTIGGEGARLLTIDDAHPAPDGLCEAARHADFAASAGDLYPGLRADAPPGYAAWLESRLADIVPARLVSAGFAVATADPAGLAPVQRIAHFDTPDPQVLAMVHYLSRGDHGGTRFYRHRASGFERITADRAPGWRGLLREDAARHGMPAPRYIADGTAAFDWIDEAPWRFNRIVLYPANLLHAGHIGESWRTPAPAAGRLTITALIRI